MQGKKDVAIVTGASSGIGLAISMRLCQMGFDVYGIGRDFTPYERTKESYPDEANKRFHRVVCDLLDTMKICEILDKIKKENVVKVLVNNAGVGYYGLHEEISPQKLARLVRTNVEAPLIITQQLLRELKKNEGYAIYISSVTADKSNPHGCAYGATKAAMSSFANSLFEEARKYGVKVVTIQPDMAKTNLYREASFCEGEEAQSYLLPEEVAEVVEYALTQRAGVVVNEITLRPQLHRIRRK